MTLRLAVNSGSKYSSFKLRADEIVIHSAANNIVPIIIEPNSNDARAVKNGAINLSFKKPFQHRESQLLYQETRDKEELKRRLNPLIEKMAESLERERADAVLISGTYYFPWCLLEASKMTSKPVFICYSGIMATELCNFPKSAHGLLKDIETDFWSTKFHYIFPSALAKRVVENMAVRSFRSSAIIPNGVSDAILHSAVADLPIQYDLAFIGLYTPRKNHDLILRLAKVIQDRGIGYNILYVSGDRPEKIPTNVTFSGLVNREELARMYASSRLVLCPSRFETFGNVALESVAVGTPALITSNMGVAEIFKEIGLDYLIIEFNSMDSIIKRISKIINSNRRVPVDAINTIKQKYTWESTIRNYAAFMQDSMNLSNEQTGVRSLLDTMGANSMILIKPKENVRGIANLLEKRGIEVKCAIKIRLSQDEIERLYDLSHLRRRDPNLERLFIRYMQSDYSTIIFSNVSGRIDDPQRFLRRFVGYPTPSMADPSSLRAQIYRFALLESKRHSVDKPSIAHLRELAKEIGYHISETELFALANGFHAPHDSNMLQRDLIILKRGWMP